MYNTVRSSNSNLSAMQLQSEEAGIEATTELAHSSISQSCTGCKQLIKDRYLLKALDCYWHEDCLKCSCCGCRLGEVGSTLFAKTNLILCRRDYLRLFGSTGTCNVCRKTIPAFELVMRAQTNVYHLECFACQQCNHRFCVGDRFYLCENKILCEYDYEERMIFANMQSINNRHPNTQEYQHPSTGGNGNHHMEYNAISRLKQQTENLSDSSSGYSSPSPGTL